MRAHSRFVFPAALLALSLSACGSSEPAVSSPVCGNGVLEAGEACDDGNASSADGCLATCVVASCGDGFVQAGVEACDDGNASSADGCLATCVVASCGDGFIRAGVETCDDGGAQGGDGCSAACAVEAGYACAGEPSVCQAGCGDGVRADPEECDDGGNRNLDGCDAGCRFEQVLRARALTLGGTPPGACPHDAFGGAISPTARSQLQTALTDAVVSGDLTLLLVLRGLDAPDGLAGIADASLDTAVVGGGVHPDYAAAFSNASQLDGWFLARAPTIDANRVPASLLPASLAGGVLAAGPGRVGLPFALGGVASEFALVEARLGFTAGGLSAPAASPGGSPPGHTLSERLLATLQSFEAASAGHICGGIQARSLAAIPLPAAFLTFCSSYTAANTLLDLMVSGCTYQVIVTIVTPTQPDMVDPAAPVLGAGGPYRFTVGAGRAVTGCRDAAGAAVDLQGCLDAAAYSSAFGFAADRVIVKPACGDGVVDPGEQCDDGNALASDGCSATCTVEAGWACTGSPSVCTLL